MKITIVDWGDNVDKEKLIIDYGFEEPTVEKQLNEYGVTMGDKAELVEKLKNAVLLLYVHDILTEGQEQRAIERLHKMVEKEMKMV